MAISTITARQFFNIPSEYGTFTAPSGVFVVTGSVSRLLINNTRTNLSVDSFELDTSGGGTTTFNSNTNLGWWPAGTTAVRGGVSSPGGIIVGGNDLYTNTGAGAITPSYVSVWGWDEIEDQNGNDVAFISLAGNILGTTFANTGSAKTALRSAGYYYQYPEGFDGQSPNTGTGSDV
jgi:hypothetical protein